MQIINHNGWIFQIQDSGEAVLTECRENAPQLVLPSAVEGHPVTGVEPDAFDDAGPVEALLTEKNQPAFRSEDGVLYDRSGRTLIRYPSHRAASDFIVPSGVKVIGAGAFAGAARLAQVEIPDGVTEIGTKAFAGALALSDVLLPSSLTRFGYEVFRGCSSLTDVHVPRGHAFLRREGAFLTNRQENILLCCLAGGHEKELAAPEDIRFVDEYAFCGCEKLEKIHFHHGLRTLSRYAFYHCYALRQADLPEGLRSIGSRAFSGCAELRTLYIPDSVTSIEYKAFNNCHQLVLSVNKGSYAARYCRQFGFPCRYRIQWPWHKA